MSAAAPPGGAVGAAALDGPRLRRRPARDERGRPRRRPRRRPGAREAGCGSTSRGRRPARRARVSGLERAGPRARGRPGAGPEGARHARVHARVGPAPRMPVREVPARLAGRLLGVVSAAVARSPSGRPRVGDLERAELRRLPGVLPERGRLRDGARGGRVGHPPRRSRGHRAVRGARGGADRRPGHLAAEDFLREMCDLGANRLVDGIACHPYACPLLASDRPSSFATAWNRIRDAPESLRGILAAHGSAGMPIWITEYGAPTVVPEPRRTEAPGRSGRPRRTSPRPARPRSRPTAWARPPPTRASAPSCGTAGATSARAQDTSENHYGLRRADGRPSRPSRPCAPPSRRGGEAAGPPLGRPAPPRPLGASPDGSSLRSAYQRRPFTVHLAGRVTTVDSGLDDLRGSLARFRMDRVLSSVVGRALGLPASSSACCRHLRSVASETPSSPRARRPSCRRSAAGEPPPHGTQACTDDSG